MRTLHFATASHAHSGGVRTFYSALLDHAERSGRHMTLVVPGPRDGLLHRGVSTRIYSVAAPHAPVIDRRYRVVLPHKYLVPNRNWIWRLIGDEDPDLVEVADKLTLVHLGGLLKRRSGRRPTVVGLSHERLDDGVRAQHLPGSAGARFARWYMRSVYLRQFDAHIANSAYTADELHAAAASGGPQTPLHWRMRSRIFVLPLGADIQTFDPGRRSQAVRDELLGRTGGTSRSLLVVFTGRLSPEKHARDLLPAVHLATKQGCDVRLVVAGDGPLRPELLRDAAEFLPGRCVWLGHVSARTELATLVASADVFLHPNPREPFGIGALEAFCSGVPVVLPRRGGVLSYACDETAWLVPPGAAGLSAGLTAVASQPDEARRRATNAVARGKSFGWPVVAERYVETYRTIDRLRRCDWAAAV